MFVYTLGAIHPQLLDNSYDAVLDKLLRTRRDTSKRIFTASEITAADFIDSMQNSEVQPTEENVLLEIDRTGYIGLEEFVRDRLIAEGLSANLTQNSGDGGADIVVRDEFGSVIYLIQCKHTTNIDHPIDAGLLEDARRVRDNWRAPEAVVVGVSNAKAFAPRVIKEFKAINGRLIARDKLSQLRFS